MLPCDLIISMLWVKTVVTVRTKSAEAPESSIGLKALMWDIYKFPSLTNYLYYCPFYGNQGWGICIIPFPSSRQICHPNILLLMGVTVTGNLIFERVACGSLFTYIHHEVRHSWQYLYLILHPWFHPKWGITFPSFCQQRKSLDDMTLCQIFWQIASGLRFLHDLGYVHCSITSHAVHLVQPTVAKLGNFECMIHRFASFSSVQFLPEKVWVTSLSEALNVKLSLSWLSVMCQ